MTGTDCPNPHKKVLFDQWKKLLQRLCLLIISMQNHPWGLNALVVIESYICTVNLVLSSSEMSWIFGVEKVCSSQAPSGLFNEQSYILSFCCLSVANRLKNGAAMLSCLWKDYFNISVRQKLFFFLWHLCAISSYKSYLLLPWLQLYNVDCKCVFQTFTTHSEINIQLWVLFADYKINN